MSISNDEIKKLGDLARIEVSETEIAQFKQNLESILAYVDQIQNADVGDVEEVHMVKNVVREDDNMIPTGTYTEDILNEAPDAKDGFIKVKKIL
jgi:aspartyl-tRNA(Asn)/glutamyl-tRNA(Gln) amidotransferase subunit C